MRKVFLKSILGLAITFLVSSCAAFHRGYMLNSTALNSPNFSYVKQNIRGESTARYVLGIGGLGKNTLVDDAKQKMLNSNPLKNNQALANLTVNFRSSYHLGIFSEVKCTVTADVVEFK